MMARSVRSTLEILQLAAASAEGATVRELATGTPEVSTASTYRIVRALAEQGFLVYDRATKRYRISLRLWELGVAALNQHQVRDIVAVHAGQLALDLQRTVSLGFLEGWDVVFTEQIQPVEGHARSIIVASRVPAPATAFGKAFLSYLSPSETELDELLRRTPKYTERTVDDVQRLREEVELARRRGYAEQFGEFAPGWGSYAVAICDYAGKPRVAVGVLFRLTDHDTLRPNQGFQTQVLDRLLACAERIRTQLGGRPRAAIA